MVERLYRFLYPMRVILIGCGNKEKPNIMAAAWCTPISFEPSMFGVAIAKKRFSYELISQNKEFTINVPGHEIIKAVNICGTKSGREHDKFKESGLTAEYGKINAPMIKECNVSLECKLINEIETGDHVFLIGEVVETVLRKEGKGVYQSGPELVGI